MVFKAAIIGCGRIAGDWNEDPQVTEVLTHAKAYAGNKETRLVACADVDLEKAKRFASRWGAPAYYDSYEKMLEKEELDLVSVCTPTSTHHQVITDIVRNSRVRAILAEKPISGSSSQAREIVGLCKGKGMLLNINYPRRFDRNHLQVKKMIDGNELGGIQGATAYYTKGIRNNGSHMLNLMRYYFGKMGTPVALDNGAEGYAEDPTPSFFARFGKTPCFVHGLSERDYSVFELHMLGEKGRVRITNFGNEIFVDHVAEDPLYKGYRMLDAAKKPLRPTMASAMSGYLANTVNSVKGLEKPLCDGETGLNDLMAIEEIMDSLKR